MTQKLATNDSEIASLIKKEEQRQKQGLELIASENYISKQVREALGSVFENKYAEGYPKKRYYTGNIYTDEIEDICIKRAKKLFNVPFVNVQPYSGSPANLEIFASICQKDDIVLSQLLSHGGHLSMGQEPSYTSRYYQANYYHLTKQGEVDYHKLEKLALKYKPKIIWSGGTAYTKIFDWKKYASICQKTGAYFVADISHIAGLVAAHVHPSPVKYADVVMTTTHKTLRGPRGAIIMVTDKGLSKNPDLPKKINYSVFPGHQGGPHIATICAIAVALKEAGSTSFTAYAKQIVKNAKALALRLQGYGFKLVGSGTDNHMIWMDLRNKDVDGWQAHVALEKVYIFANKQTVPFDPRKPYYPSGFRLGTAAVTTRGMKEKEMEKIAVFIKKGIEIAQSVPSTDIGHESREKDQAARKKFKKILSENLEVEKLKKEVIAFASRFPVP